MPIALSRAGVGSALLTVLFAGTLTLAAADPSAAASNGSASGYSTAAGGARGPGTASAYQGAYVRAGVVSTSPYSRATAATQGVGLGSESRDGAGSFATTRTRAVAHASASRHSRMARARSDAIAFGVGQEGRNSVVTSVRSHAVAFARSGHRIVARASANSLTKVRAVAGDDPALRASVAPGGRILTRSNADRSIIVAVARDGSYSIAIATDHRARAFSGTLGQGVAVSIHNVRAAARTSASASAIANRHTASADAHAIAYAAGSSGFGYSSAVSISDASARARWSATRTRVSPPQIAAPSRNVSTCASGVYSLPKETLRNYSKHQLNLRYGACDNGHLLQ
jgi:hypothetical protein